MAISLPFNDGLETASVPKIFEITRSLTGFDTCMFTVINYRDHRTHEIEVQVTRISKIRYSGGAWMREFQIEGDILKIDNKSWGPPAKTFDARYIEDNPRGSIFKLVSNA
ncbi:MAG TPA: hypothetical protein VI336_00520 [Candidatus Saccharimonadales bacterium]|nr:hypothetical protein [Candidatus Saccharimonadales bacterium]